MKAKPLIKNYNNYLTKNEDWLQYLLHVVEGHRDKFLNTTKYALKKAVINNNKKDNNTI